MEAQRKDPKGEELALPTAHGLVDILGFREI